MNSTYQFLLPGLVLPLVLSLILATLMLRYRWSGAWGLAAIWLIAYFWIRGLPVLPPREAVDWLWIIGIITLVVGSLPIRLQRQWLSLVGLLTLSLGVIAWPVLRQNLFALLSMELAILIIAGAIIIRRLVVGTNITFSALPLAIISSSYAIIAALSSSLLVGQLSSALAAALGGFALYELTPKAKVTLLPAQAAVLANVWLLCLMLIGRVYANLNLVPLVLLIVALILSRVLPLHRWWQVVLFTGIPSLAALLWLVLPQDASSYY